MTGDLIISSSVVLSAVDLMEVGVPPLECSLVGEIDLARSKVQSAKALPNQHIGN